MRMVGQLHQHIGLGEDAHHHVVFDHRQAADLLLGHNLGRFLERGIGADGDQILARHHQVLDRHVGQEARDFPHIEARQIGRSDP
jgi:hypothetical protein